jgi:hypothetical protein
MPLDSSSGAQKLRSNRLLSAEYFATLSTAVPYNITPTWSTHSRQETVPSLATTNLWLERSFHDLANLLFQASLPMFLNPLIKQAFLINYRLLLTALSRKLCISPFCA